MKKSVKIAYVEGNTLLKKYSLFFSTEELVA